MESINLAKLQSLPSKYYLLDLEFATHKNNGGQLPLEIGVVKYQNGRKVGKQFHRFVYWADAEADDTLRGVDYANVTYKTYRKQGQWQKIVSDLLNFMNFDLPVGGWNVHGDLQVLVDAINDYSQQHVDPAAVCYFEVDELVSWLGDLPVKPSLRGMGRLLGFDVSNMHHALSDVLLTAQIYDYLAKLPELVNWQDQRAKQHARAERKEKAKPTQAAKTKAKNQTTKAKTQAKGQTTKTKSQVAKAKAKQPAGPHDLDQQPVSLKKLAKADGSVPVAVVSNPKQAHITNDQSVIDQLANHYQHSFKRVAAKDAKLGLLLDTNASVPKSASKQSPQFRYLAQHQVPILPVATLAKELNIKTEKGND